MARLAVHSPAPRAVEDAIPHFPRRDSEDPATVTPSPGGARRGRLSSSSSQGLSCDTRIGVTPCAPAEDSPLPETPSVHSVHTGFRTPAGGDDLPEPEQTDSPVTKRSRRVFGGSSERPTIATGIATSYGHEGHSEALAHGGRRQERGRSMTEVYAREDCLVAVHGSSSDLTRAMRTGWDGTDSPLAAPSREGRLSTQLPLPQPESPTADARRGRARDRVRPRPREQADALPSVSDAASALAQATSPKAPAPEIAPPPTALSSTLSASSASASSSSASSSSLSSSSPNALVTLSQAGSDADVATLPAVPIPHSPPRPGLTAVMEEEDSAHGTAWAAAGAAAVVEEQDAAPAAPATPGPALHADLPPDFSPGCPTHDASQRPVLPTVGSSDHHDLKCVDGKTVKDLIDGRYTHVVTRFLIFDCRFPYEYEGGHIKGAISSPDPDPVSSRLFDTPPSEDETVVLLFHCEFSKNRGPKMCDHLNMHTPAPGARTPHSHTHTLPLLLLLLLRLRQMREFDRRINSHRYPCLHYPQMFLIHKGYRQVYADVPVRGRQGRAVHACPGR